MLVLTADLLFGSRVQGALAAAGHDVQLVADEPRLRRQLAEAGQAPPAVLVVDLTDADMDGSGVVAALSAGGELEQTRTLGFYSHVDASARERAERAGFDLVVARSRMAREGAEIVSRLAGVQDLARE